MPAPEGHFPQPGAHIPCKIKSGTQVDALCGCDCHFGACRSIVQHLAFATAFDPLASYVILSFILVLD